jgi:hypothetical protein
MTPAIDGSLPKVSSLTTSQLDPKVLTPAGAQLKQAADAAAKLPMGPDRAKAFGDTILPLLLKDATTLIGGDAGKLAAALAPAVAGAGAAEPSLGLKNGDKGLAADTDYPPRAANAVWSDFAAVLGISPKDAALVTTLNERIGKYPKAEGKYAPAFEALSPKLQKLATKVSKSLMGEDIRLSSTEKAFKANLVLNNLTWHMTNFERASGDATRADPLARNNVFNAYSDNLAYAAQRGGLPAVIDMAISDAYNAGKPGVGKAALGQPKEGSSFGATETQAGAAASRLSGGLPGGATVGVPQRDVFGVASDKPKT